MTERELSEVLLALNQRAIRFFSARGCRREDAEDLAGDLIRQVLARESSMRFLAQQQRWITEKAIPKPLFRQLYRLLKSFRRRSGSGRVVPFELFDCSSRDISLQYLVHGRAPTPIRQGDRDRRDTTTHVLDLFAEALHGKQKEAFQLLRAGYAQTETAHRIGVDDRTIRNWLKKWHMMATSYENN